VIRYQVNQGVQKVKSKTRKVVAGMSAGLASLMLAVAIIPAAASADSASINFENPPYTAGNINGQDGWSKTGPYDAAVVNNIYGISSFGSQSLRISNGVTSGSFGDQTFSKPLVNEAGETDALNGGQSGGTRQPHFETQFDIASTSSSQQPGLVLSVSPDRGDGARMSYLRFEDQADGIHVFFDDVQGTSNPANFVETEVATITRAPHAIKLSIDFVDGPSNDVVKIYIDGALKHTGTTWENYYRFDDESNPTLVSNSRTVDSLLFRTGGTAVQANQGNGFLFDNLSLLSGPIPVNTPTNKDQCKGNGWKSYGSTFKDQGDCVSFVATKGKNQPSGQ
jgi:hypothetical protein